MKNNYEKQQRKIQEKENNYQILKTTPKKCLSFSPLIYKGIFDSKVTVWGDGMKNNYEKQL